VHLGAEIGRNLGKMREMEVPELPRRLLLGPGPSNVHPRVLQASNQPLIGHADPAFHAVLADVCEGLRRLFGTSHAATLPLAATGSGGMEACFANLVEPGDAVVVGVTGTFGDRMCDVAQRLGARLTRVEAEPGAPLDESAMAATIARERPALVAFVHAETSTGVCQPVEAIARTAREADALVLLDCATSLGGIPVALDAWDVDAAYSTTQKCLSCPPGLSPLSFSERAVQIVENRKSPVASRYFDLGVLLENLGDAAQAPPSAAIPAILALAEGLRMLEQEGMETRAARHRSAADSLVEGLAPLGFEPVVEARHRLPMITALRLPEAVRRDGEAQLRRALLDRYGIEVGSGIGPLEGEVWRIGLMGENARIINVEALLFALRKELT
jgi:alanine-glyoxylate transaminase/serine-glyoxylate transaminase/serine-pyruvate transaminase